MCFENRNKGRLEMIIAAYAGTGKSYQKFLMILSDLAI